MRHLVCLTATEWRNLCARGWARVSGVRVVRWDDSQHPEPDQRVFAMAPQTKLEASDDLLIAELFANWSDLSAPHVCATDEDLRDLELTAVKSFYPVAEKDRSYFDDLASKAGVTLEAAEFENAWGKWIVEESVRAAERSGKALAAMAGSPVDQEFREDGNTWNDLARLVLRPSTSARTPPTLLEEFLRLRDRIIDQSREDHENQAHVVSAPLEWSILHQGEDILDTNLSLKTVLTDLHEELCTRDWSQPLADALSIAHGHLGLLARAPKSFSVELTPLSASLFLRYFHKARYGGFDPTEFFQNVAELNERDGSIASRLVSYLIGAELGPEKVRQIELSKGD